MRTEFVDTSSAYENENLAGENRILDICKKEKATTYVNAQNGKSLYNNETFSAHGIELKFVKPELRKYEQIGDEFVPGLSVLDAMMNLTCDEVFVLANQFELTE